MTAGARQPEPNTETRLVAAGLTEIAVLSGLIWALAFPLAGTYFRLQEYGDGSVFSYAVAVENSWLIHWQNIPGRLFVYLYAMAPAEWLASVTHSARAAIFAYGFLFFSAQALGLIGAYWADNSPGRTIFRFACASTAILCPLVFGAPTEMWMAHALFWPALAVSIYSRESPGAFAIQLTVVTTLMFTHEGAIVLELVILAVLAMRGVATRKFLRAGMAFAAAILAAAIVKARYPIDPFVAPVIENARNNFFNPLMFANAFVAQIACAAAAYLVLFALFRKKPQAPWIAASAVIAGLGLYWIGFDHSLHTQTRYFMRTILLLGAAGLGMIAGIVALERSGEASVPWPRARQFVEALTHRNARKAWTGALAIMMAIHAVETGKFVSAWREYRREIRQLAAGAFTDTNLGNPRLVSAAHIPAKADRLSWNSTTPYLSVLATPGFRPAKLVVDPEAGYFWMSCATAAANAAAARAIPQHSRELVRDYACLKRP